jgi:hypothetical protein
MGEHCHPPWKRAHYLMLLLSVCEICPNTLLYDRYPRYLPLHTPAKPDHRTSQQNGW